MARVLRLYDQDVEVLCPHCGEEVEVELGQLAVTCTKVDCSYTDKDSANHVECPNCEGQFTIHAHADLEVSA